MNLIVGSVPIVWGVPPNANRIPIELPDDVVKVRIRFRNTDFARCWLKTSKGIRAFYLGWNESKTHLKPMIEQGSNYRDTYE